MALNLNSLRYIVEVAKSGSISKTSEQFYISQPHLSNTIRSVEKDLGVELFTRSSKGMTLTPTGAKFVERATHILCELNSLETDFANSSENSMKYSISFTRSYYLMSYAVDFIKQYANLTNLQLELKETNSFQVLQDVNNNTADWGVLSFSAFQKDYFLHQIQMHRLKYSLISHTESYLIMSKKNPLAKESVVRRSMLKDQILVFYGDNESPQAPYLDTLDNPELYQDICQRQIRVYDRGTVISILRDCPNTYFVLSSPHIPVHSQPGLIMRKCEDLNIENYSCIVYKSANRIPIPEEMLNENLFYKKSLDIWKKG